MSKNKWRSYISLVCVLALSSTIIAYAAEPPNRNSANSPQNSSVCAPGEYGGGMMGGSGGGMMGRNNSGCNFSIIDDKTAETDMTASLSNAAIDKQKNTIIYTGKTVKIVMFAGPEGADEKFVIGELINPTLRIEQGASVTLEIINKDDGAQHGVEITSSAPPYAYMTMMQGGIYPGTFIRPIPAAKPGGYSAAQTVFIAGQPGIYYYICQYPGHAEIGMYGQIIIE